MKTIYEGLFSKNPVFGLLLGLVPAVAITYSAYNGLVLGITTGIILVVAVFISSLLKSVVPKRTRPVLHVGVLTILTVIAHSLLLQQNPKVVADLGIFLPLIVVNSFVLYNLDQDQAMKDAVLSAVGNSLGFVLALVVIGVIREFLSFGTVFGTRLLESTLPPLALAGTVPGGMVIVGLLLALYNKITGQGGELHE